MKKELIKKAWQIRKEASNRFSCKVSEIDWKECLVWAREILSMVLDIEEEIEKDSQYRLMELDKYSYKDFFSIGADRVEEYFRELIDRKVQTWGFKNICKHYYQGQKWNKQIKREYFSNFYHEIKNFDYAK